MRFNGGYGLGIDGDGFAIGGGSGDVFRDLDPLFMGANGGGSACINGGGSGG